MKNIAGSYYIHCLFVSLIPVTAQSEFMNDVSLNNKVLVDESMTTVFSLTHCSLTCGFTSCSGVFYNEERKLCVPRRGGETEIFKSAIGWMYYSKKVPTLDWTVLSSIYTMYAVPTSVNDMYTYITSHCQQQGTHLVRLESSFQHAIFNQFIGWYFYIYHISYQSDRFIAIDGKQGSDFKWYHSNGNLVKYFHWRPGQPENLWWRTYGNETLLTLWDYKMNDLWNDASVPYIYYPVMFACENNLAMTVG